MPPISWTSYGTMSHFNPWPVTTTSLDNRRRLASRTVAKASGRTSSRAACSSSWRRIPSTTGRSRFSSRLNRLPRIFVNRLLTISPLVIQPVGGEVLAHRVGYEIADRASALDVLPDRGPRDVERRHLDDAADQGMPGHAGPGAGEHDDTGEAGQRGRFVPGRQVLRGVRPQE